MTICAKSPHTDIADTKTLDRAAACRSSRHGPFAMIIDPPEEYFAAVFGYNVT